MKRYGKAAECAAIEAERWPMRTCKTCGHKTRSTSTLDFCTQCKDADGLRPRHFLTRDKDTDGNGQDST